MLTKSKTYILILTKNVKHTKAFFLHTLFLEKGSSN